MSKLPVFQKSSANEKLTIFLERRDVAEGNAMAGVVVADVNFLKDQCIFIQLCCSFRYGHEDDEMFGLKFQTDSIIATQQLYFPPPPKEEVKAEGEGAELGEQPSQPNGDDTETGLNKTDPIPVPEEKPEPKIVKISTPKPIIRHTLFQERIIKKFGADYAFPFYLPFNGDSPSSVSIESGKANTKGKEVGLEYYLKAYAGEHQKDYTNKNNIVKMGIRKLQYAPQKKKRKGSVAVINPAKTYARKEFFMSRGAIEMTVSLDKQIYNHGDAIKIVLGIQNKSAKSIKKYKTLVEQYVNMSIFKHGGRRKNVITSFEETEYGVPIPPGGKLNTFVHLTPTLGDNKGRAGIAKDGQLRFEDGATLASSSLFADPDDENAFGIIVSYSVKVKLYMSGFGGVVTAEIPFFLMHSEQGPSKTFQNRYRRTQSLYY